MKYLKKLLTLFAAGAFLFSCQKEYSVENGLGANVTTAQWQFNEGTTLFKGPIDTAYVDTVSSIKFLTLEGKSTDKKDFISLQIYATDLKAGTYKSPLCSFSYQRNGTTLYQSDITATDSFSITIGRIDAVGVSGTFNGKVKDGAGVSKTIVDGRFAGTFKKLSTTPPVTDSGQVMLWSKTGCGGGNNPIAVTVNGKTGQVTSFYPTEPASCGTAGAFTVKLPVGTYTWKAKCGVDSINGSVSVSKNSCTKVEVNFSGAQGDYFPLTTGSNWTLLYQGGAAADSTYTLSTGQTSVFGANTYNIFHYQDFFQGYKDTLYYRKGAGIYYEYFTAAANILHFDNPTAFEYIFLKDNVPVSTPWETTVAGAISGIPVTAKIQGKILEKAASLTVGAITFQDVIRVQVSYFYVAGTVTQVAGHVEQWYARGKGLIKQLDYITPPYTQPTDVLNLSRWQVY